MTFENVTRTLDVIPRGVSSMFEIYKYLKELKRYLLEMHEMLPVLPYDDFYRIIFLTSGSNWRPRNIRPCDDFVEQIEVDKRYPLSSFQAVNIRPLQTI